MEQYILPLFCLLLNFVTLAACLRFVFSHGGQYWILPAIMSLLLLVQNGSVLYAGGMLSSPIPAGSLISTLISIFWYAIVVAFRYALKSHTAASNYAFRVRKDLTESRFLLKTQEIQNQKRLRRLAILAKGESRVFDSGRYPVEWTDLFDRY